MTPLSNAGLLVSPGLIGSIAFESRWPIGWILPAGCLFLALIAGLYLLDLRSRGPGRHRLLLFLRLAAIAILLLLFLQPVRYARSPESEKPTVAILIDASGSMRVEEEIGDPASTRLAQAVAILDADRNSFFDRLRSRFRVKTFTFATDTDELVSPVSSVLEEPETLETLTNLGQAMLDAAERLAPESLAALVIFTDGAWNVGPEPVQVAHQMAARAIPIFPVAMGTAQDRIDVAVESALADEVVLPGDRVTVQVVARGEGLIGEELDLRIQKGAADIVGSSPTVRPDGLARETITFDLPPDTPPNRPVDYSVWAVPRENEISDENNRTGFRVTLVERPLKVLLVNELPRWEFRYLKNALLRDPGIEVQCMLLDYQGVPVRGEVYRNWYPDRSEVLAEYDVVVLGDVSPVRFSPMQLEATRGYVDAEGGSIVFQAGTHSSPLALVGTPFEELLPVVPQATFPESAVPEPFGFALTAEGKHHPAFALIESFAPPSAAWEKRSGFRWFTTVGLPKPAASVLATHPFFETDTGRVPLAVTMRYGRGRVLYLGVDSTWRWRFGVGDEMHHRFWGRLIRWLAENRFQGGNPLVRLTLDRRRCSPGEEVEIHARVLDRDRYPLDNADVQVEYESGEGNHGEIPLTPDPDRQGHYRAKFNPRAPGEYVLRPRIPSLAGEEFGVQVGLTVESRNLELADIQPDHQVLARIAAASDGRLHSAEDLNAIPREIEYQRPPSTLESKFELWASPYVIIIVTCVLGMEWWLRKKRGLA